MGYLEAIRDEFMTAVRHAIPISQECITIPHTLKATLLAASHAIMVASILIRALIIARQKLQPQDIQTQSSFGVVIKPDLTIYGGGGEIYYVTQVQPNSPADGKLDIGDIIRKINGQKVSSANVSLSTKPDTKLEVEVSKLNKQDFRYDKKITTVVELVSDSVPTYNAVDAALHEAISAAIFDSQNAIINATGNTDPFINESYNYDGTKQFIDDIHAKLLSRLTEMNTSLTNLLSQQQPQLSTRTIVKLMKDSLDIVRNIMEGVKMMYSDWSRQGLNLLGQAANFYCNNAGAASSSTIKNLDEFSNKYLNTYLSVFTAPAAPAAALPAAALPAASMQTPIKQSSFFGRLFKKGGGKKRRTNNKNKKTRNNKNKKTRNNKNKKTMNKNKNKKTMMTIRRKKV